MLRGIFKLKIKNRQRPKFKNKHQIIIFELNYEKIFFIKKNI